MGKFKIEITSVPDRDNLVAEMWYGDSLVAEVYREEEILKIELYKTQNFVFLFEDFFRNLEDAKHQLLQ